MFAKKKKKVKLNHSIKCQHANGFENSIIEALESITELYYDEDRNKIHTGNVWDLIPVGSN